MAQQTDVIEKKEVVGRFSLKEQSKWLYLGVFIWALVLMALLTKLEALMGTGPRELGLGKVLLILLICIGPIIVAHEGIHGIFFLVFGSKVNFGFKWTRLGPAAFTIPIQLLPRLKFQMVALAPQILTLVALVLLRHYSSPVASYVLILIIICNLGGGFLDFYVMFWLSKFPKSYLVEDTKEGGIVYKC